ncbi:hypothetical protein SmJEL517_g02724 [Synchytrium microbalum]|uniref:Uncharacterized protein n=1 Tax=Synchytrium microbalum TaxID=1806994 RepID=A0A507C9J3_9FUNG|nr:uncharacterized protein SmJEL517_g02724 [Synchytrium microbalum]TPX34656.1 hypothetical protein SmJEL517_g02724 [Synchytrium microbalum]
MSNSSICELEPGAIEPGITFTQLLNFVNEERHVQGWIIAGACAALATTLSIILIIRHLINYNSKDEQRHIVRILLMVPIYSIISWISFRYYYHSTYYNLIRDVYEAFVIYSFFELVLLYLGDDFDSQKLYLKNKEKRKFIIPLCCMSYQPSSSTFLTNLKIGVMQYVIIKPLASLAAAITESVNKYCPESMSPMYAHLWLTVTVALAVSLAMFVLLTLYFTVEEDIKERNPLGKFLSIKFVIFLTFWQQILFGVLTHYNVLKQTDYWTAANISGGLQDFLVCIEMLLAAIAHYWTFGTREYRKEGPNRFTNPLFALFHAFNPWDIFYNIFLIVESLFHSCAPHKKSRAVHSSDVEMAHASQQQPLTMQQQQPTTTTKGMATENGNGVYRNGTPSSPTTSSRSRGSPPVVRREEAGPPTPTKDR